MSEFIDESKINIDFDGRSDYNRLNSSTARKFAELNQEYIKKEKPQ